MDRTGIDKVMFRRRKHERGCKVKIFSDGQLVCGKGRTRRKRFPQSKFGHSTLTEKIHSYRIAASEGLKRSMVNDHDEARPATGKI